MDMTTTARVQALLESGGASAAANTALIGTLIANVSARVAERLGRAVLVGAQTEVFATDYDMRAVLLHAFPVSAVASVRYSEALPRAWTAAEDVSDGLYTVDLERGIVWFDGATFDRIPRSLEVKYTGGMAANAAAFVAAYPDLAHAVDLEVAHLFRRRMALGGTAQSAGAGSTTYTGPYTMLPEVLDAINLHRRRMV